MIIDELVATSRDDEDDASADDDEETSHAGENLEENTLSWWDGVPDLITLFLLLLAFVT